MFSLQGFEADDLIASWWRDTKAWEADRIVILSSDKDFLQLAGRNHAGVRTEQVRLSSYGTPTDRWDAARVHEVYGCVPSQLPVVMALTGDTSDNVKGISGIGPKRAVKLLAENDWDLRKVAESKGYDYDQLRTNYKLVNLRESDTRLPRIPDFSPTGPGDMLYPRLTSFLVKYELNTIRDRLTRGVLWHAGNTPLRTGRPYRRPEATPPSG
jgi:DNA polymerase I